MHKLYFDVGLNIRSGRITKIGDGRYWIDLDAFIPVRAKCEQCGQEIEHTHNWNAFSHCVVKGKDAVYDFEQFPENEEIDKILESRGARTVRVKL